MEKETEEIFKKLKKDILTYAELQLELLKLNAYERSGKVVAILSYSIILISLVFITILFLFLALGFFLGELLGSQGLGFGVVAIFYLILILTVILTKKRIHKRILNSIIFALTASECKEDPDSNLNNSNDDEQTSTDTTRTTDC